MSEALAITQLLEASNKLSAFCTQNGWIISDSIAYEILERHTDRHAGVVAHVDGDGHAGAPGAHHGHAGRLVEDGGHDATVRTLGPSNSRRSSHNCMRTRSDSRRHHGRSRTVANGGP